MDRFSNASKTQFCSVPRGGVKQKIKVGRGPFEQCVGDFCSVPRGGVKKKEINKMYHDVV